MLISARSTCASLSLLSAVLLASLSATSDAQVLPHCTDLPVLFIVQDMSGSMAGAPDSTTTTSKWTSAQIVVPNLANQFAARFRFGVMMYPGQATSYNCSPGVLELPVPSSANSINTLYATSAVGGGTPTATTLTAAKNYLLSLNLNSPAYVLLITDGLPNCNTSLNAATCTATTPGCQGLLTSTTGTCALGAKDCLDSNSTVAAAQALFSAGIRTYVVGFGSGTTSNNNQMVLNAVAAAGGTSSAYIASNQAQLASQLNAIANAAQMCCRDVCTAGAAQCLSPTQRQVCQTDATSCTVWVTQNCPSQSQCSAGTCVACTNACTAGARRCNAAGDAEECQVSATGCTSWVVRQNCGYGETCSNGVCNSCSGCLFGSSRCNGNTAETCSTNILTGCSSWTSQVCTAGNLCQGGRCQACNTTCTAGTKRCNGQNVELCTADVNGCTSWVQNQACTTFCSGGACGVCGTTCSVGTSRCNGNASELCSMDQNNCTVWGTSVACAPGTFCTGGTCMACPNGCTPGAKRCSSGGGFEVCSANPMTGCGQWGPGGMCDVAGGERCDVETGNCLPPCIDECALGFGKCTAGAPQVCERAPTGCTVWQPHAACTGADVCVSGACRSPCTSGEIEACVQPEFICTGLPEGRLCLPGLPDGGVLIGPDPLDGGTGAGAGAGGAGAGSGSAGGDNGTGGNGTGGAGGNNGNGGNGTGGSGSTSGSTGGGGSRGEAIGARTGGCNCSTFDGQALVALLGFATLLRRRARR